jgi:hypothetical protein
LLLLLLLVPLLLVLRQRLAPVRARLAGPGLRTRRLLLLLLLRVTAVRVCSSTLRGA